MTAFYVTAFLRLFEQPGPHRWLVHFAPLGRMALTAYLTQTVVGALVFFGIGLGLLGKVGHSVTVPLALVLIALEIVACAWWLRYFQYGPCEWLWRSLTLLRLQPLSRARL